ncbi:unnamed protein product [Paramecium primaurelia]|uniref:Uncharacterized protein n=1 Tax=Paramecium primaurelia TaxID=5886 RepID=A0A8S1PLV7_PARPR|nr:unnamed protein product [Paramecium primaurelia]
MISFLSSCFIGLTSILSSKRNFWTFRIIFFQSLFECIDLGLALIYNIQILQEETLNSQCNLIGYIMHSSWISSFCCCFLMIYQMKLLLKVEKFYETLSKHILKAILLIAIFSYLWLLTPFILDGFVPTGWNSFEKKCKQYFFCGFGKDWKLYLVFWSLPLILIFLNGVRIGINNKKLASIHLSTFQDEEFQMIKDLQKFPIIYSIAWTINQVIRYIDLYETIVEQIVFNHWLFGFYVLINLIFELHLLIVLYYFIKNYNKVLNIKQVWLQLLCCQKKVEIKDKESLLYQDVNGTS